jgi:glycosyltransferase involved in cell wall biosynthesis
MSRSATVSVIMATFNGAKFISEQLDSLANQTHLPYELIVSDDGSSDETLSIVTRFKVVAPFPVIIIMNRRRLGYGENFLSAASASKGMYLAFCDQDDIWMPNKLETAVAQLTTLGIDLYVHTAHIIDEHGKEIGSFAQGIYKRQLFEPMTLPPWGVFCGFSMTFRRDILDIIDPSLRGGHTFEFEGQLSHDLWIYFISASLGRVFVDKQELAKYRRHNRNETPNVPGSFLQTLSARLGAPAHPKLRRDAIAEHRSQLMLQLDRPDIQDRLRIHAKKASDYWKKIARFEARRIGIYSRESVARRAVSCAKLLFDGGYRAPSAGGLGWRLFVKDALVGVLQVRRWKSKI